MDDETRNIGEETRNVSEQTQQDLSPAQDETLSAANIKVSRPRRGAATIGDFLPSPDLRHWDRYQLTKLIGAGGMGRVYAAFDPQLKRKVAVKFLNVAAPEKIDRFLHEARAQARVEHDYVCKVYEVGEVAGLPYIAMPYIKGETLDQAAEHMSLEQKLVVIKRVAEGMHEAHRAGLIHRDLKPSNIMVESTVEGDYRPYIMDFGLARFTEETGMTIDGSVMGTPSYMSPEQAVGASDKLDRRSDVYAIGATLFQLLCRRPPFQGATVGELMLNIQTEEPERPRRIQPAIPKEVETIILGCLEKKPDDRYPSARALAEDIGRFLDGDAIMLRPAGWFYRLRKKARKHKALFAAAAVASIAIISALAWSAYVAYASNKRQQLTASLFEEVEEIETLVRNVYLSPPHDIRPHMISLQERLDAMHENIEGTGDMAIGPGNYALGYGHLVLDDLETARDHLILAWDNGYDSPRVAYALGLTYSSLYRRHTLDLQLIADAARRKAEQERLEREFRDTALTYLRQSENYTGADPEYPLALIAYCEGDYDRALEILAQARQDRPWLYETLELSGDVYRERANRYSQIGEKEKAAEDFNRSLEVYRKAGNIARSDPELYIAKAQTQSMRIADALYQTGDLQAFYRDGLQTLDAALVLSPEEARIWLGKASLHRYMALRVDYFEDNPVPYLELAAQTAARARDLAQDTTQANLELGHIYWRWAEWLDKRSLNADRQLKLARNALEAVDEKARNGRYYYTLGVINKTLGDTAVDQGGSGLAYYERASGAFAEVIARHPDHVTGYNSLANVLRALAAQTGDPQTARDHLGRAATSLQEAIKLNPALWVLHDNLGRTFLRKAQSGDPHFGLPLDMKFVDEALSAQSEALARKPASSHYIQNSIGLIFESVALDQMLRDGDPLPYLDQSQVAFETALELAPNYILARGNLAWNAYHRGKLKVRQNQNPSVDFSKAEEIVALLDESTPVVQLLLASIARLTAEWRMSLDDWNAVLNYLDTADQHYQNVLTANPYDLEANRALARAKALRAIALIHLDQPSQETVNVAEAAAERALSLKPKSPYLMTTVAHVALIQAMAALDTGNDPGIYIQKGLNHIRCIFDDATQQPLISEAVELQQDLIHLKNISDQIRKAGENSSSKVLARNARLKGEWRFLVTRRD